MTGQIIGLAGQISFGSTMMNVVLVKSILSAVYTF